mmetsp:Transcript_20435/g.41196  ORF Transcript_20435/g.41196 Transcript_20435/m.41196 type:complete len:218 (-) Transcript_20435:274-927(-)
MAPHRGVVFVAIPLAFALSFSLFFSSIDIKLGSVPRKKEHSKSKSSGCWKGIFSCAHPEPPPEDEDSPRTSQKRPYAPEELSKPPLAVQDPQQMMQLREELEQLRSLESTHRASPGPVVGLKNSPQDEEVASLREHISSIQELAGLIRSGPNKDSIVVQYALQVARALDYIHEACMRVEALEEERLKMREEREAFGEQMDRRIAEALQKLRSPIFID